MRVFHGSDVRIEKVELAKSVISGNKRMRQKGKDSPAG
jgi:hypothetical protein